MVSKFDKKIVKEDSAPVTKMTLEQYFNKYGVNAIVHKEYMQARSPIEFWSWLFEPSVEKVEDQQLKGNSVNWPYANRLIRLAMQYMKLTSDGRRYVYKARTQDIFWRGDRIDQFEKIVEETLYFRNLDNDQKKDYKKRAIMMAETFMSRHA